MYIYKSAQKEKKLNFFNVFYLILSTPCYNNDVGEIYAKKYVY